MCLLRASRYRTLAESKRTWRRLSFDLWPAWQVSVSMTCVNGGADAK
jgi:hypothetical protein